MVWAPEYVTTLELAQFLRIDDTVDDAQLTLAVSAASRAVDNHVTRQLDRQFGLVDPAVAQVYTACLDRFGRWVVEVDDFQTIVDLTVVLEDLGAVTTFVKEPQNAIVKGRPWTRIVFTADSEFTPTGAVDEVGVIAKWGWTTVPPAVKQATLLQASRLFARRTSPYGVAGSPEMGNELRLLARLDPDVATSLRDFVRWPPVVG